MNNIKRLSLEKKEKKIKLKGSIKEIKFDHITYSYGYNKPIIDHLDLVINGSLWLKGDTDCREINIIKIIDET